MSRHIKGDITPEQAKMIHLKSMGATTREACQGAGITQSHGYVLLRQENIKAELARKMDDQGINADTITSKIAEGFESLAPPRKDGGIQYADMFTRRQYIDMAVRMLGLYAPEELNINQKVIHITITPEVTKGLIDAQVLEDDDLEELEYEYIESIEVKAAGEDEVIECDQEGLK